jgi:hypothetical protein
VNVLAEYVTKTVKIEDEEITIKKLSIQDSQEIDKLPDAIERGIATILKTVLRWSFKNIDGNPLAITKENIQRMRADIITQLGIDTMIYSRTIKEEEKKNG